MLGQSDGDHPPKPISVGSIAVARRQTGVCDMGERGVCYEVYTLDNRLGYSFLFESGCYDGFSPQEVDIMLAVTDISCPAVRNYQFTHVSQLDRDFRAGRFAAAFPKGNNVEVV
jgi:hypothetical protein